MINNFIQNLSYDYNGLLISLSLIILLIIGKLILNIIKPKFVIPSKKINYLKRLLQKIIITTSIIIIIIFPLNIGIKNNKKIYNEKKLNVQIIFDVSLSMAADDIPPSRFEIAKSSIIKLLELLEGYNISLITFSGISYIWAPFSDSQTALINKLEKLKLSDFPPTINFVGTAIGDSILLGINNLLKSTNDNENPGIIILLTDGDSNKGSQPKQASVVAKNNNIIIYTLGIGIEEYLIGRDYYNSEVKTTINIPLLEEISQVSGGKFYRVLEEKEFQEIFAEISNIIKSKEIQKIYYEFVYINNYLGIILIFLIILIIIINFYVYIFNYKKGK